MKMLTINECYKNFVKEILEDGKEAYKDNDSHILEKLGNYYHIEDPLGLKYKARYEYEDFSDTLIRINRGEYNMDNCPIKAEALIQYVLSMSDPRDKGFAYTYSNRFLSHFDVNQIKLMRDRLLESMGSNRAVAVTYDPKLDGNRKNIPCLQVLQATVRDNELSMHCFFRSNDIYGAFYSNMYFITAMGMMLKDELNDFIISGDKLGFGGVHYYSSSAHIYWYDLKAAKRLVRD